MFIIKKGRRDRLCFSLPMGARYSISCLGWLNLSTEEALTFDGLLQRKGLTNSPVPTKQLTLNNKRYAVFYRPATVRLWGC